MDTDILSNSTHCSMLREVFADIFHIPFKKTVLPVTKSSRTVCNYFIIIIAFILHHLRLGGFYFKAQKVLWNAGSRNYGK